MDSGIRSVLVMALIFVASQLGALFMAASVLGEEYQAFENPNDPMIPIYYIIAIVFFTFGVLYIIKKRREDIVRIVFLGAVVYTVFYVLLIMSSAALPVLVALVISLGLTAVLAYYLVKRPEWYIVDATGMLVAVGIVGILGISLQILPVLILLVALAVYDAISVYGTKHMVALADGVTSMRLPILLVIPKKRGYSYLRQAPLKEQLDSKEEREAMFMGLGDIVIPGVLITSAFYYLGDDLVAGIGSNLLVALGTLAGAMVGFAVLMRFVLRGNPQAGLPLLNGGAIAGYAVTYLLVFGDLGFGITIPW
jgi:presenilin-like A22 family membrane protease